MAAQVPAPPYPKAPIVEALLGFHFEPHLDRRALERFARAHRKSFPAQQQMFDIKVDPGAKPSPGSVKANGFILTNADKAVTIVVRPETISAGRLPPYTTWDDLVDHAKRVWEEIKDVAGHPKVSRLSTRFINRIDIRTRPSGSSAPPQPLNLGDYFQLGFTIPPQLAAFPLETFHMNWHAGSPTGTLKQTVQLGAIPPPLIDYVSFVLDIDVATTGPIPMRDKEMWAISKALRERKNELFQACITDKTRRLFA